MKFYLFKDLSIRFKDYWGKFNDLRVRVRVNPQGLEQIFQFSRTFQGVDAFSRTIQALCGPWKGRFLMLMPKKISGE